MKKKHIVLIVLGIIVVAIAATAIYKRVQYDKEMIRIETEYKMKMRDVEQLNEEFYGTDDPAVKRRAYEELKRKMERDGLSVDDY